MPKLFRFFSFWSIFITLTLASLLAGSLRLARPALAAPHGTIIEGIIATDTTWTAAGSPYQIYIEAIVPAGVTLTIEPGVTVENYDAGGASLNYQFIVEGRLLANGTAAQPIRFNPGTDGWSGLNIVGSAEALNTGSVLDYVILEKGGLGGSGSAANLRLYYADVTVRHSQFNNSPGDGILGDDGGTKGVAHISDSSFTHNAGYAVLFQDGSVNPVLSNLTASGNGWGNGYGMSLPYGGNLVAIDGSDTIHGAHIWENMGLPYLDLVQLAVGPDATLTIQPGVQVLFAPGNDALNVQGRIIADGAPGQEIRLDPADPAGGWSGLRIIGSESQPAQGNLLDEVMVTGGGHGNICNLYLEYGDATITNSQFSESGSSGVCLGTGASLAMNNTLLTNNAAYAMDVFDPNAQFRLSGLSASGNLSDTVGIGDVSFITGAHTWPASGIDTYDLHGTPTIAANGVLTVTPGVTLRFEYGRGLTVRGELNAQGTPERPIRFTGWQATPGFWGMSFTGTAEHPARGNFSYATLEYGGYGGSATVEIENADVSFDHCTLQHSAGDAIRILPGMPSRAQAPFQTATPSTQIHWSQLADLSGYAIDNQAAYPVQATYNWWGATSGPSAEGNPGGNGSRLRGAVLFLPYLLSPHGSFIYLPVVIR